MLSIRRNFVKGYTFIEILISLIFLSLLLIQLINSFIATRSSFKLQSDIMTSVDKTIRLNHFLKQQVQQAGNMGCIRLTKEFPNLQNEKIKFNFKNKITIDSNSLQVKYASSMSNQLLKQNKNTLIITNSIRINHSDTILISDCRNAELVTVLNVTHSIDKQNLTLAKPLTNDYDQTTAQIAIYNHNTIFLNKTDGTVYFLKRKEKKMAIIEGIRELTFYYTILRNSNLLTIVESDLIANDEIIGLSAQWQFTHEENHSWQFYTSLNH